MLLARIYPFDQFPFQPWCHNVAMENETTSDDSTTVTVVNAADLGCPNYSNEAEEQVELFSFWVEGVSQASNSEYLNTLTIVFASFKREFESRIRVFSLVQKLKVVAQVQYID